MLLTRASRYVWFITSQQCIYPCFQIRPTEEELKEMGPEFNELWKTYFKDKPDKPVMVCGLELLDPDISHSVVRQYSVRRLR